MDGCVGRPVQADGSLLQWQHAQFSPRDGVSNLEPLREGGHQVQRTLQTQPVERVDDVGTDLYPRADLTEGRSPFKQAHITARTRAGQRSRQPANAPTDNQYPHVHGTRFFPSRRTIP